MVKAKKIDFKICTCCNKYLYRNKWAKFSDEIIVKIILDSIMEKVEIAEIKIPEHKKNAGVNVDGEAKVVYEEEEYVIPFKIRYTLCDKCSKMNSDYYEAILQLRNPSKETTEFIIKDVDKNKEKGVFITKKEDVKGGIDFYLTSQRYAQSLGKKLKKTFKGELKVSRKLFTVNKQNSKLIYRVNVLFRVL